MRNRWRSLPLLCAVFGLVGAVGNPWWSEAFEVRDDSFEEKPQLVNDISWTPLDNTWTLVPLPPHPTIFYDGQPDTEEKWKQKIEPPVVTKYGTPPPPKTTQAPDIEREDRKQKVPQRKPTLDGWKRGTPSISDEPQPPVNLKPPAHSRPERITGYVPAVKGPIDEWTPHRASPEETKIIYRVEPIWLKFF